MTARSPRPAAVRLAAIAAALTLVMGQSAPAQPIPKPQKPQQHQRQASVQQPPRSLVVLFAGWTPPGDTVLRSGISKLAERVRAAGVPATIENPADWRDVANRFVAEAIPKDTSIAIVGYSMGGNAATLLARWLGEQDFGVRTLVTLETGSPVEISPNVERAVNFYRASSGFGRPIVAGPGFSGALQNVDIDQFAATDGANYDHWSISRIEAMHKRILDLVLDVPAKTTSPKPAATRTAPAR